MNFNWIKTALLAATAMVSLNSFSQDLIARQAPIDRKLKSVDSLALQNRYVRNNHCIRVWICIPTGITNSYKPMAMRLCLRAIHLI